MSLLKVATAWLDGCSGCHMSFLDNDEKILELSDRIEIVYSPLVDSKTIPPEIDLALVEGAVSSESDKAEILKLRASSKILISFGDCAVTANVPGMRNHFSVNATLSRAYVENSQSGKRPPTVGVPKLIEFAKPIHEYVHVDFFLPGCPPPSEIIFSSIRDFLEGKIPSNVMKTRFGA